MAGGTRIFELDGLGGFPIVCGLVVIESDTHALVLFIERDNNPGVSVTNIVEPLARRVWEASLMPRWRFDRVRFFELYEHRIGTDEERIDEISLAGPVRWWPLRDAALHARLIDAARDALRAEKTGLDARLAL